MKFTLHKVWIEILIAGLISLFFGIAVILFPSIPLRSFIWIFAFYMFSKGLSLCIGSILIKSRETYWHLMFWYGTINIITGIVAGRYPNVTIIILGFIVSINMLLSGIMQLIVAYHLRRDIPHDGWLVLSGFITLVAGIYIYLIPRISGNSILILIAIAALVLSIYLISLSIAAKNWHHPAVSS